MSEEEIITRIKDLIHTCDIGIQKHGEYDNLFELDRIALVGILDLYKNKKQKNSELQRYKDYYETEKVVWIKKDYISKDKIKEKYLEMEREYGRKVIRRSRN